MDNSTLEITVDATDIALIRDLLPEVACLSDKQIADKWLEYSDCLFAECLIVELQTIVNFQCWLKEPFIGT